MVERFNRTVEQYLSKVVECLQSDWDEHFHCWRTEQAINEIKGQIPTRTVFGKELRLSCDVIFGSPETSDGEVTNYVESLR